MELKKTGRGFGLVTHEDYPDGGDSRLIQESSAISPIYDNAMDLPGSSYLWVGENHHLNREQVAEMVRHMMNWLATGKLHPCEGEDDPE